MSDTPEYTQRELGQRFLIDRIGEILKKTGRSTGYPGEPVFANVKTAKKAGVEEVQMAHQSRQFQVTKTIAGPPAVTIARVTRDGRTSDGTLTAEGVLDSYEPQTLVNAFIPKQTLSFLDLDTELLNLLQPTVKVYKAYPRSGGGTFDVRFRQDWLKNNPSGAKAWSAVGETPHKDIRVGFTGCTITKMGENPGLVDSNIKVQLTVETQDLNNLFYRWHISPQDLAKLSKEERKLMPKKIKKHGVAWIDLIKMDPKGSTNSNSCDLSYDPPQSEIKLVIGYGKPSPAEVKRIVNNANEGTVYHKTSEAAEAAILANPTLTESAKERLRSNAKHNEKLIDDTSEEEFNKLIGADETSMKNQIKNTIDAITNHREIFYLQLSHHEFILGPDLQVQVKINYVGRSEVMQRTPGADLLSDPRIRNVLAVQTAKMDSIKASLGEIQEVEPREGLDEDSKESAELRDSNLDREACRAPLEGELERVQNEYDKMLKVGKKRLYNQLLLKGHKASRVYKTRIPKDFDLRPTSRGARYKKGGAAFEQMRYPLIIRNYRDPFDDSMAMVGQEELDRTANGEEMNDEKEAGSEARTDALQKSFEGDGSYRQLNFIFIGDIVEAALELVAYNNEFSGMRHHAAGMAAHLRHSQENLGAGSLMTEEYGVEPLTPTELTAAKEDIAVQEILDDSPMTTFFSEVNDNGTLGPIAKKTIKLLGKYVFGDIVLPIRSNDGATRYVNIADIPIDYEYFRTFWFNNVISKPKKTSYFLKDLVNGIMKDLIPYAISNRAVTAYGESPTKSPTTNLHHFSLPGTGAGLNARVKTEMVPKAEYEPPSVPPTSEADLNVEPGQTLFDADGNPLPGESAIDIPPETPNSSAAYGPHEIKYVSYFTTTNVANQLAAEFDNVAKDQNNTDVYEVILIQQKPSGKVMRTGNRLIDKSHSIQHYTLNVAGKKALISATFKRNDLPAMQTANIMKDSVINSRGIMREKYDADVLLRGNVVYKPGAVLYLDHTKLQSSRIIATTGDDPMWPLHKSVSPARALGLGGYFTVTGISHDFGDLGTKRKWTTTLTTKWLSFEHIEGLPDACGEAPKADAKISPEMSQCLIEQGESRIENAAIAAAEASATAAAAEAADNLYHTSRGHAGVKAATPGSNSSDPMKRALGIE